MVEINKKVPYAINGCVFYYSNFYRHTDDIAQVIWFSLSLLISQTSTLAVH